MGQTIRETIRLVKNNWIQNYFKTRIGLVEDPYQVVLRPTSYKVILILSHMRSGSSLLTHLLVSNPEIIGYGETHIAYNSSQDLKKLLFKAYWKANHFTHLKHLKNLRMDHPYVLDKLLHDNKLGDLSLLTADNVYALFLLREPCRSLASIQDLKPHLTQAEVTHYYCNRLARLESYARLISNPQKCLFITHNQIINQTDQIFETLQTFLRIQTPLSENYSILKTTGNKHVGDSKGNINTGKIIRQARTLEFNFTETLLAEAQQSFDSASATLSKFCSALPQKTLV